MSDSAFPSPQAAPRRHWLRRLAVLSFTVALGLMGLELAVRILFARDGMHFGIEMWKYTTRIKERASVAEMGHQHQPGARAFLMGAPVEINSHGLRDREHEWTKPRGTYRILVLGDSITFGWGVRAEDTFARQLEADLNARFAGRPTVEVINSGVGNYNTRQEVSYYRERGHDYTPDLVILAFFINDAEPIRIPPRHPLALHSQAYVLFNSSVQGVLRGLGVWPNWRDYYRGLYADDAPGWQDCRGALDELFRLTRDQGADTLVAIIPELHVLGEDYPFADCEQKVVAEAADAGVRYVDLRPALASEVPESLWVSPGDAHPNARGHRLIADGLLPVVDELIRRRTEASPAVE